MKCQALLYMGKMYRKRVLSASFNSTFKAKMFFFCFYKQTSTVSFLISQKKIIH